MLYDGQSSSRRDGSAFHEFEGTSEHRAARSSQSFVRSQLRRSLSLTAAAGFPANTETSIRVQHEAPILIALYNLTVNQCGKEGEQVTALESIKESAASGKLLVIAGAGASMALASKRTPSVNWQGLINRALKFGKNKGVVDDQQMTLHTALLQSGDLDSLLVSASYVTKKLGGLSGILYSDWLSEEFAGQQCSSGLMKKAMRAIASRGVPIATLNYDKLIEKATGLPSASLDEPRSVMAWARRETASILHLHGVWDKPQTIVLNMEDYSAAVRDDFRTNLQRNLAAFNRVLFIGCGATLSDPNLSALICWMKDVVGAASLKHYALVKDDEVQERNRDPLWHGFVDPIGYGENHEDLPTFILNELISSVSKTSNRGKSKQADSIILDNYRSHIIKDCGKMTIEGVRADDDTANQKFDLEKLFVPLEVKAIPPEFPESDPQREEKLKRWTKENGTPLSFGGALQRNNRMALLALPGGGKTMLLKRLAVAYADKDRRVQTADDLPDLDLVPVMIRCREWRSVINLPIASIIDKVAEISGDRTLAGLFNALEPRLKSGRVLLLVDGLDEIHNDADRTTFVENLESFLSEYSKIRLVVTSREAGFALVAACLTRFCDRWRIAPLNDAAITLLCGRWHDLMSASAKDASIESAEVVETIFNNPALRRLAENPLLLTMLLVVKHGHGRLPPDRVSLYWRAIEVLLDTWNIKGHAALNPKEAVPQLAYIAFKLLQQGKQTATEKELLRLIEECRLGVPLIRFYAKDTPHEFLKRVELRSSLLLEAGRQMESGRAVPFYQFRHLTFQEYLAAVAVVEGHYDGYQQGESIVEPFRGSLASDEWKEVVPMAAVLAKKQADPLIMNLIHLGKAEEDYFLKNHFSDKYSWSSDSRLPAPVSRLAQCLVEEAEFSQTALDDALRLIVTFAHGCMPTENWAALRRGPFGDALFDVAWDLFVADELPREAWLRNTVALLAAHRKSGEEWMKDAGLFELKRALISNDVHSKGKAAGTICGIIWLYRESTVPKIVDLLPLLEANLVVSERFVRSMTLWAIAMILSRSKHSRKNESPLSEASRDILVQEWLEDARLDYLSIASFALAASLNYTKSDWRPKLSDADKEWISEILSNREELDIEIRTLHEAAGIIKYHARLSIDKGDLAHLLQRVGRVGPDKSILWKLAEDAGFTEEELLSYRTKKVRKLKKPR